MDLNQSDYIIHKITFTYDYNWIIKVTLTRAEEIIRGGLFQSYKSAPKAQTSFLDSDGNLNIKLIICYCLINFSGKSHANLFRTFRVIRRQTNAKANPVVVAYLAEVHSFRNYSTYT